MIGTGDRAGPIELRMARGIKDTPIRADAAFKDFPRLIDCFDDVVVDAVRFGAADEVAQNNRLLDAPGVGILHIVTSARPAEFGNDDALAGIGLPKFVVNQYSLIDRLRLRKTLPVGQYVSGDIVDSRDKLGMLDPYVPDFACRHRHIGRALHALNHLDE